MIDSTDRVDAIVIIANDEPFRLETLPPNDIRRHALLKEMRTRAHSIRAQGKNSHVLIFKDIAFYAIQSLFNKCLVGGLELISDDSFHY